MMINYNRHTDYIWIWSEYCILSLMTGLWVGKYGVQFLGGSKICSLLQNVQTCSGAHLDSRSLGTGVLFIEISQPWHEANHSPPSSSEVKNEWSNTSTSPVWLCGLHRDTFTFRIWIVKKFDSLNYCALPFKS